MPKSSLQELPIIDVEYTSQMRVKWELLVNSGQTVNFTVSCRQWKESWMLYIFKYTCMVDLKQTRKDIETNVATAINFEILLVYWSVSNPRFKREENGWCTFIKIWRSNLVLMFCFKNFPNCTLGSHLIDSGLLPGSDWHLRKIEPILKLFFLNLRGLLSFSFSVWPFRPR